MIKYTKHYLNKLEDFLSALDYTVRYEKGSFQSGYCIVENRNMIVMNRFLETESRISNLLDIIQGLSIDENILTKEQKAFLGNIVESQAELES